MNEKIEVKQKYTEKDRVKFDVWLCARAIETQLEIRGYVV
jgi:hypothetical protein